DLKTNKFVYAGAVEEISIQELAQTKEHYIGLAYDSEEGGAYKEVLIFEKPSNRLIQTIYGGESKEEYDLGYSTHCFGACLSVGDYNFDGIEDFSLFYSYSRFGGEDRTYLLYDLKKRQFFLSELGGHNLIFDNNTKTIRQDIMHEVNYGAVEINAVFKVVNNKMQKIKEECALVHYDEESETFFKHDCKDGYWGGFWHLSSTGLKKNFELFAALSDDKAKGVVIYKGQSEFITLVLNAKNGGDYIYDEIYMGKKNGQYIFTINENGEVAVSYTNKDGKKI
ncbi:MAG: hypothetical protein LBP54_08365, partial [Campylobacteraceae bacterium]|nr:hypothetical protein [Campylobacteraceae bacterium]